MLFIVGATSQSIQIQWLDDSGFPVTGKVAADFPALKYQKSGPNAEVSITLANLAALTTAWSAGGVKEISGGWYRLDLPDAMFTSVSRVSLEFAETAGKRFI